MAAQVVASNLVPNQDTLPSYTARTPPKPNQAPIARTADRSEHTDSLETANGHKWVSLTVKSRSPNPRLHPAYFEGDVIEGRVDLDLEKPESVKAVVISALGGTTSVGQEEVLFLDIKQNLWTPTMGQSAIGGKASSTAKLRGKYSWPFSIALPGEVSVPEHGQFRMPPTSTERASPSYIDYRLVVTVKRGALRVNQTLSTNFNYMPISRPDPPSVIRQLAYREGTELLGPDGDPLGWKVLPPVTIKGTLFDTKSVEVECTLAIATPLAYAINSPLPVHMSLASTDTHALDLLSTPSSIHLQLVRSLAIGSDAMCDDAVHRSSNFFFETVGQAFWWTSTEGGKEDGKRALMGELDIGRLWPSFAFPRHTVRYTLDLLPPSAPGFVASDGPLLKEPVTIVTAQAPGIVPRSYAPPGYVKPEPGDYNKAMGLLENGNQRFVHHHGSGIGLG